MIIAEEQLSIVLQHFVCLSFIFKSSSASRLGNDIDQVVALKGRPVENTTTVKVLHIIFGAAYTSSRYRGHYTADRERTDWCCCWCWLWSRSWSRCGRGAGSSSGHCHATSNHDASAHRTAPDSQDGMRFIDQLQAGQRSKPLGMIGDVGRECQSCRSSQPYKLGILFHC
jgi:hypothetical protein